uniref:(northern house mosquito) hypothetical protein n=1 Tax=Culex pipiens TaxID=7175 RepID=A0A8D8A338_CULPI
MEHLLHLLACRFPLVLVIFVNRNPATAAISEPDPLELLLNFGAFLSGINDIFDRFYSRLLYFHLLDLLQSFAAFRKVPVSNTNEPSSARFWCSMLNPRRLPDMVCSTVSKSLK